MRRRQLVALSMILGLTLVGSSTPTLAGDFDQIVLFATNSIDLNTSSDVLSGDVVVNNVAGGPTIGCPGECSGAGSPPDNSDFCLLDETCPGTETCVPDPTCVVPVELVVGQRVTTAAGFALKAPNIEIKKKAVVGGDVVFEVLLDNDGTINGTSTGGISPPYTLDVPVFEPAIQQEAEVLDIPDSGSAVLPAGTYGDIRVGNGATALFSGGLYNVRSIDGAGGSQILFDGPSDVRIAETFRTANNSVVGPAPGSGVSASEIILYVAGENDASDPETFPFAAKVGNFSDVDVNFYVPNGTLRIKRATDATGAFLARDVHIERDVQLFLDSVFVNLPLNFSPTAFAQEALTDGANDLVITLEGSDPEGGDLSFSIELNPVEGTLGAITPITPATVDQCSQSGVMCTVDSDCPGFAEGETCDTVQPPITQATVTYTPNLNNNCVTDPESGEVTCPEDFFTFGVTDDGGLLGTAIVSVNGGSDEVPDDPGVGAVQAINVELGTTVNQVSVITLSGLAPDTVASLTFRVETLPTGTLEDSNAAPVVAGVDLPSPVLTYQAPGTDGADPFTFSARDSLTTTPPCGPPSCDTGTVNIGVGDLPDLAPDQSVGTNLNTPVEITLRANAGGTGTVPLSSLVTEVTYGDNGPPLTAYQLGRLEARNGPASVPLKTAITVGGGWDQFGWCDIVTTPGCNDLVDLVNESEVIESPFDFTTTEASCLRVTDTLAKGDHFRVENLVGTQVDWTDFTSEVDQSTVGTTGDPDVAFGDLEYSHGEFDLSAGTFSIRLTTIPPDSFAFGTAGYIRVDTGPCVDIVWTITSLPAVGTGTLTNLDGSAVQIGDTFLAEPTVVFTPDLNFSGSASFEYEVTQGGTLGIGVLDTAVIDLLVALNDNCVIVGRDPGCAPGLVGSRQGGTESGRYVSELSAIDGPSDGLTFIVKGAGTVTSSPMRLAEDRILMGLSCSSVCTKQFPVGSLVGVFARPDGNSEFVGWGGDCSGDGQIGTVRLARQTVCTATFREQAAD